MSILKLNKTITKDKHMIYRKQQHRSTVKFLLFKKNKLDLFISLMCEHFAFMYVCVTCLVPVEARRAHWGPWNWSYRTIPWVPGIKPRSSRVLNHRAISLAPQTFLIRSHDSNAVKRAGPPQCFWEKGPSRRHRGERHQVSKGLSVCRNSVSWINLIYHEISMALEMGAN